MAGRGRPKGVAKSPGSGRKKGTPNKRTVEVLEILEKGGFDPHAPFIYWARVLKSAMTRPPAGRASADEEGGEGVMQYGPDEAEQFYQGVVTVSDGEAGSHIEPIWARASADMALSAAAQLAQYIAPKRSAVKIDMKRPHDMTDDELDAAIRAAYAGGKA